MENLKRMLDREGISYCKTAIRRGLDLGESIETGETDAIIVGGVTIYEADMGYWLQKGNRNIGILNRDEEAWNVLLDTLRKGQDPIQALITLYKSRG